MFSAKCEVLGDRIHRYTITDGDATVSFAEALDLWQSDETFHNCFDAALSNSPYSAFRWETPPITGDTVDRQFEFVLLDSPGLVYAPDTRTFAEYFNDHNTDEGVVVFDNLGKDAVLVVPSPRASVSAYGHLAAFVRTAPAPQKTAFWRVVGRTAQRMLSVRPLWISTAGGGVAWLHARLDSYPKYYGHGAYRNPGA